MSWFFWTGVLILVSPVRPLRSKHPFACLRTSFSAALAPLGPFNELEEQALAILLSRDGRAASAAAQELVELIARGQRFAVARQPVLGRLEASPAGQRRCEVGFSPLGMTRRLREV